MIISTDRSLLYLLVYVLVDASKALFTDALNSLALSRRPSFINPIIILFTELLKLAVSTLIIRRYNIRVDWSQAHLFAILTFLYYINSSLYLRCFSYASAPTIQLLLYIKIPVTVVVHHVFIRKQSRWYPWMLLGFLLAGALTTQITDKFSIQNPNVLVICVVLSMNSALASIYNEKLIKSLTMPFWSQQVITYALTATWSLAHISLQTNPLSIAASITHIDSTVVSYVAAISLLASIAGISTGLIIKSIDTIARLLAGIIVSVVVTIGIFLVFDRSPESWFFFTAGSMVIGVSVYLYGMDLKAFSEFNSLTKGRRISIDVLLAVMMLSLPVSLVVSMLY
jgi:Nucleotide-sugar transporter